MSGRTISTAYKSNEVEVDLEAFALTKLGRVSQSKLTHRGVVSTEGDDQMEMINQHKYRCLFLRKYLMRIM